MRATSVRPCEGCGQDFTAYLSHGDFTRFCDIRCWRTWRSKERAKPERVAKRFWGSVDRSALDGCWPWLKGRNNQYGSFKVGGETVRASRFAYQLAYGAVPDGMHVLHRCDNPPCCNPAHLFLGTHDDNMKDMAAKGRRVGRCVGDAHGSRTQRERRPRGEKTKQAKLTEQGVREIRAEHAAGASMSALGRKHGVSSTNIRDIVLRKRWAHVY